MNSLVISKNPSERNTDDVEILLRRFTSSPEREREWLDLLSQLEYVGLRKIIKSIPFHKVTLKTLQHLSEEASHAFLMKGVAEKLGLPSRSYKNAKLSEIGFAYMDGVDRDVSPLCREMCYEVVSYAIEQRVLRVYPVYLALTRQESVRRALRQILGQEKRHLAQFELGQSSETKERVLVIEAYHWKAFTEALFRLEEGVI